MNKKITIRETLILTRTTEVEACCAESALEITHNAGLEIIHNIPHWTTIHEGPKHQTCVTGFWQMDNEVKREVVKEEPIE
jgi:hypothetical protein